MEDIFQSRSRAEFADLVAIFIANVSTLFPDCTTTQDMKIFYTGCVKGNLDQEKQMLDAWYSNMMTPLKKAKYAKAVERLTGASAKIFHACAYKDIDGLEANSTSEMMSRLGIFDKYRGDVMSEKDKEVMWKYINELNTLCIKAFGVDSPVVPSREEIQNNISSMKKKHPHADGEAPSMSKAFQTSMDTLCKELEVEPFMERASTEEVKECISKWTELTRLNLTEDKKMLQCCTDRMDAELLKALKDTYPTLSATSQTSLSENAWAAIFEMNGYAAVGGNIPQKMLGEIESVANRLADDLVSGKTDLSNMNIAQLGEQILTKCDESEMAAFASNIDNILPALQNFNFAGMPKPS